MSFIHAVQPQAVLCQDTSSISWPEELHPEQTKPEHHTERVCQFRNRVLVLLSRVEPNTTFQENKASYGACMLSIFGHLTPTIPSLDRLIAPGHFGMLKC